jgi:hypothetical protein
MWMIVIKVLAFAAAASGQQVTCVDDLSSEHLTAAVDAALMELQGEKGWFHQLRSSSGYANALGVFSCTPDADKWKYPKADEAEGLLKRVLDSGELKVAGVQWAQGGAADYKTNPDSPTGFWPSYLTAIAEKLSAQYGKTIAVKRVYYTTSVLVNNAVDDGEVDMSEPYYYLSGFHQDTPRIESLAFSCVTAGMASKFFTLATGEVRTTDELYDKLVAGPNRAVGFIGQGNYDAVSALLPDSTAPNFVTNASEMRQLVLSGALVAGYISEGEPDDPASFHTFETGIISPRVALFRKTALVCTADSTTQVVGIVVIAVLAVVALLLAGVLAHIVRMERKGSPLFVPLVTSKDVEAVSTTSNKA